MECGCSVRVLDLKSRDPKFKSCSDHKLDFFQVVPDSTLWLGLHIFEIQIKSRGCGSSKRLIFTLLKQVNTKLQGVSIPPQSC